jgi:methyltransferase family protein
MTRLDDIEAAIDQPPQIHKSSPIGCWMTDVSCYRFIGNVLAGDARTLETGCGVSTVLFTKWSAEHTCVVPSEDEAEQCAAYLDDHGIDRTHVSFAVGFSDEVLPRLEPSPLDLILVDGSHAFPAPIIDWYYAGSRLTAGGVAVIDDLQLPSVRLGLSRFLEQDPRWRRVGKTPKWAAYQRSVDGSLREEWVAQRFLDGLAPVRHELVGDARQRARGLARKVRSSIRR